MADGGVDNRRVRTQCFLDLLGTDPVPGRADDVVCSPNERDVAVLVDRHPVTPWARKTPKVTEVLPLLYLHGLSTGDFVPALGQFLGPGAGLSAGR